MLRATFLLACAYAEDASCLLQSKPEKAPSLIEEPVGIELTEEGANCPNGELVYTFTPNYGWSSGAQTIGSVAPGVQLTEVSIVNGGAGDCVVTEGRGAYVDPDTNLLLYEQANAPGQPCTPSTGRASITMTFDVPQTFVAFGADIGGGQTNSEVIMTLTDATRLTYDISNDGDVQPRVINFDPPQRLVKIFRMEFGGPVGLRSFTLCKFSGSLVGDPHIKTLDGGHYTLLQQGTFSAWHFKGMHTNFTASTGLTKTAPVDWQILAHYSGHLSFTRGLLLLDTSGSKRQAAEITSKECIFRMRKGLGQWEPVQKKHTMQLKDSGSVLTGLKIVQLEKENRTKRYDVHLSMNTLQGIQLIATLRVRCIPGHHINSKISMERPFDANFVDGQMGTLKKGQGKKMRTAASNLQLADHEFQSKEEWSGLGGSQLASSYLQEMDEEPKMGFLQACSGAEKSAAAQLCSKHLGVAKGETFDDCVFDVCAGGGEEAAVLAGEIQRA